VSRIAQWTWRLEDVDGRPVEGGGEVFPTQSDAETWVGETWRELRTRGVEAAHLFADGERVYGPLSLRAPE